MDKYWWQPLVLSLAEFMMSNTGIHLFFFWGGVGVG